MTFKYCLLKTIRANTCLLFFFLSTSSLSYCSRAATNIITMNKLFYSVSVSHQKFCAATTTTTTTATAASAHRCRIHFPIAIVKNRHIRVETITRCNYTNDFTLALIKTIRLNAHLLVTLFFFHSLCFICV